MSRVVLTAPWKLGLFVFTLVLGCGFGLVYAYLSLFGGTLDFQDDASVKAFFMVCGGVAMMALLGYLGVVTQARPLEKVIRGSSKRVNLIKSFGAVEDPREVDLRQFNEMPELKKVLERWRQDRGNAGNAQVAMTSHREAIQSLAMRVQSASHAQDVTVSTESDEMQPLVHAINQLIHDLRSGESESQASAEAPLAALGHSLSSLRQQQSQLSGFAASVAASSEELSRRAQANLAGTGGGNARRDASVRTICDRNAHKLTELRELLQELAEESNRLAMNAALQVNQLGDSNLELVNVTEEIRSVSTRYHRLAADLHVCENDLRLALSQLDGATGVEAGQESHGAAGMSPESIQKIAMVLDQNAGGLQEIATQLDRELAQIASHVDPSGAAASPAPVAQVPTPPPVAERPVDSGPQIVADAFDAVAAEPQPAEPRPAQPAAPPRAFAPPPSKPVEVSQPVAPPPSRPMERAPESAPSRASAPIERLPLDSPAGQGEKVYDLAEFGAVEMPAEDNQQRIYDLSEFGAVEV